MTDLRRMQHVLVAMSLLSLVLAACQASGDASATPSPRPSPTSESTPSAAAVEVPDGVIAFERTGADGLEHYFTMDTDGTGAVELFTREGCSCIGWSPEGDRIWTVSLSDRVVFTTMLPDGTDERVLTPASETLNLAPGAATQDGTLVAFSGWDETDSAVTGVYTATPELNDLRQVTPSPKGAIATEPLGIAPDGSRVLFFAETGPYGYVTHAGDLYVVNADGTGLRQLNDDSLTLSVVTGRPGSMSPDGQRAVFAAFEGHPDDERSAVFVVDLATYAVERLTDWTYGVWTGTWAPTGDRITFATWGDRSVASVIKADGTGRVDLNEGASDSLGYGVWAPDAEHLLVTRGPDGQRDLWIVEPDGSFVARVTNEPGEYAVYAWAPH